MPYNPTYDTYESLKQPQTPEYGYYDRTPEPPYKSELAIASGVAAATGPFTGGWGYLVSGAISLIGGIIGVMARPKPRRNPVEVEFENMVEYYRRLGKRSDVARTVASLFKGKPKSSFTNIGYNDAIDAYHKVPYQPVGGE